MTASPSLAVVERKENDEDPVRVERARWAVAVLPGLRLDGEPRSADSVALDPALGLTVVAFEREAGGEDIGEDAADCLTSARKAAQGQAHQTRTIQTERRP